MWENFFSYFSRENKIRPYVYVDKATILLEVSKDPELDRITHSFLLKHNFCQDFGDFLQISALRIQFEQKGGFSEKIP